MNTKTNTNAAAKTTAIQEGSRAVARRALLLAAALLAGHLVSDEAEGKAGGYLIVGQDMGARTQNVIVRQDGVVTSAPRVFVNSAPLGFSTLGFAAFRGDLAAAAPAGSALKLRVLVPEGEITAFDTVPERPRMTAPTALLGGPLNVAAPITVRWTSAVSPDRFAVSATWSCGSGCGTGRTFEAAGGARELTLAPHSLPADTTVKFRIYAYNDGTETFTRPALPGSRLSIRSGDEAGLDFRTVAAAGRPDLVVTAASIDAAATCRPYEPILYVKAEVKNIGTAPNPAPSPAVGMVSASHVSGVGWGNGVGVPVLAPGTSAVVRFPIYFLVSDPNFMTGAHRFDVAINTGGWIEEASTANNAYGAVSVELPKGLCPR